MQRHQSVLCFSVFFLSVLLFSWLEFLSGSASIAMPGSEEFSPAAAYNLAGIIGTAGSITGLFWMGYRKWLWRFDGFVKIPVLKDNYTGAIEYEDAAGNSVRRHVDILISQELDSVKMRLVTNSMDSSTLIGRFVVEGEEPILYYVYRIDSRVLGIAKGSRYGAARLRLDLNGNLEGNYWTDENRRGRIWFADSAVTSATIKVAVPKDDRESRSWLSGLKTLSRRSPT